MAYYSWMRFLTPDVLYQDLGVVCLGAGVQRGPLPVVGPRTLDRHVAVVVTAGSGWFRRAGDPPQRVVAPALLWLTPGTPHHYGPDPGTGWDETFVAFTGAATGTYTRAGYITPRHPVVPLTDTEEVGQVVARIVRALRPANPLADIEAGVAVHELLIVLRAARDDSGAADRPVLEALARDAFLPMSVDEHAARLGMSPAGLRAVVRRASGRGPKEYLLSVRLGRAQELLAGTDLPTTTVARMVGFDDPAYFSRLFNRKLGMPPSQFRRLETRTAALPEVTSDELSPTSRAPWCSRADGADSPGRPGVAG
ncbi:AraC family transcriptional regulator [Streptomyces sp. NBC_00063]|uniref:helix-turn-helix domain-containing protein n=1 Tax=Streptomyces sp. NBC_00063 TaxID=2975638 RepID=UPI002257D20D|nr:AraC family transcriptional regulator [Streptomyces sp. NBC_00063]MCX5441534.1 AraC family transcriptional regulator [Streptomyces sp. NBC_00063]